MNTNGLFFLVGVILLCIMTATMSIFILGPNNKIEKITQEIIIMELEAL